MTYKHPKALKAAWLEVLLKDTFTSTDEFFLYGSVSKLHYVFEGVRHDYDFDENSDFDFAVQYTRELEDELVRLGWEKKENLSYRDKQTVHVFDGVLDGEKVQISLREDLLTFKIVWNNIDKDFYWTFLNKRSERYIGAEGVTQCLNQMFYLLEDPNHRFRSSRLGIVESQRPLLAEPFEIFQFPPVDWRGNQIAEAEPF